MGAAKIGLGGLAADTNLGECCQSVWIGIVFSQCRVDPLAGALEIQLTHMRLASPPIMKDTTGVLLLKGRGRENL